MFSCHGTSRKRITARLKKGTISTRCTALGHAHAHTPANSLNDAHVQVLILVYGMESVAFKQRDLERPEALHYSPLEDVQNAHLGKLEYRGIYSQARMTHYMHKSTLNLFGHPLMAL